VSFSSFCTKLQNLKKAIVQTPPLRSCDCAQDDEECTILPYRTTFRRALTVQRSCTTNRARKGALHCTAVGRAPHWHLLDALRPLHGYVRPIVVSRRVWRV
jgi:hypothetical protein